MANEAIPRQVRRQVRNRAGDRCEYCRHPADFSCAPSFANTSCRGCVVREARRPNWPGRVRRATVTNTPKHTPTIRNPGGSFLCSTRAASGGRAASPGARISCSSREHRRRPGHRGGAALERPRSCQLHRAPVCRGRTPTAGNLTGAVLGSPAETSTSASTGAASMPTSAKVFSLASMGDRFRQSREWDGDAYKADPITLALQRYLDLTVHRLLRFLRRRRGFFRFLTTGVFFFFAARAAAFRPGGNR